MLQIDHIQRWSSQKGGRGWILSKHSDYICIPRRGDWWCCPERPRRQDQLPPWRGTGWQRFVSLSALSGDINVFSKKISSHLTILVSFLIIAGRSPPVNLQPGGSRLGSARQLSGSRSTTRYSGHSHEQEVDGQSWQVYVDTSRWIIQPLRNPSILVCLPEFVSDLMLSWTKGEERPQSGSLVKLITQDGKTKLEFVK